MKFLVAGGAGDAGSAVAPACGDAGLAPLSRAERTSAKQPFPVAAPI